MELTTTFATAAAEFALGTAADDVPAADRETVVRSCLDVVGTLLAGRRSPHGQLIERHAGDAAPGRCTVIGSGVKRAPLPAALANGTLAHADDFDDMGGYGHPSVALLPAIAAAAELAERPVSGSEAVTAYAVGFELGAALCRGGYDQYERCFHSTPVFGTLASAAAAARILALDVPATATALSLAASHACGIGRNSGTMAKPLHAGIAASNGLLAVLCARAGMTARADAFEARGGFAEAFFGPRGTDLAAVRAKLGRPFTLARTIAIKKYPCCGSNHSALDAVDRLMRTHGLSGDDVARVTVHDMTETSPVLRYPRPDDGLAAKFSIHFTIAQRLRAGRLGREQFDDAQTRDPQLLATLPRVRAEVLSRWERRPAGKQRGNPVTIETHDGRRLHDVVPRPQLRGGPADPLSWDELLAKLDANAGVALDGPARAAAAEAWRALDGLPDLRVAIEAVAG